MQNLISELKPQWRDASMLLLSVELNLVQLCVYTFNARIIKLILLSKVNDSTVPALKIKWLQAKQNSYSSVYVDIVITAMRSKLG